MSVGLFGLEDKIYNDITSSAVVQDLSIYNPSSPVEICSTVAQIYTISDLMI